jgi:transposase
MADRGRRHGHIAAELQGSGRTIQRWLNPSQAHGLDGLQLRRAPGQPPRISESLADELRRWLKEGPTRWGLDRANGTSAALAAHLYRPHGVAVSTSPMQRTGAKGGVRPYRPTSQSLQGDPAIDSFRP